MQGGCLLMKTITNLGWAVKSAASRGYAGLTLAFSANIAENASVKSRTAE
jgi:hypothetical protein